MRGILAQETRSRLTSADQVVYVDRRRGAAGERGPTQIRRIAFDQVKKPGEQFGQLECNTEFALEITERYLLWLRGAVGSWEGAVRAYNAGLGGYQGGAGRGYYQDVMRKGNRT